MNMEGFYYPYTNTNTNNNYNNFDILNNTNYQTSVNGDYIPYYENNDKYNNNYISNNEQYSNSNNFNVNVNYDTNNNFDFISNTNNYGDLNFNETNNEYHFNNYEQYNNYNNYNNNFDQYNNIYEPNKKNESYQIFNGQNYNYEQNNTFSTDFYTGQNNSDYNSQYNNEFFVQNDNQNNYNNYTYPQSSDYNNFTNNTTENINTNYIYNNNNNFNDFNNINNYNSYDIFTNDNSNQNKYEEYDYKYESWYDSNNNLHYKKTRIPKNNNNNINNQNLDTYNFDNSINMQARNSTQPYSKTFENFDFDSEPIIKKSHTSFLSDPYPTSLQYKEEKKAPSNPINTITTIENQPPQKPNELQERVIDLQPTVTSPSQSELENKKINFHFNGLINIGSTCYMNATLQCLLHVTELVDYFLKEFPNDVNSLCQKNSQVPSKGNISMAFYKLIKGVYPQNEEKSLFNSKSFGSGNNTPVSPDNFQKVLGLYNPQFKNFEANDSKDLILYLLQTMHAELNYFGDASINLRPPNQYDRANTFQFFIFSYERTNFSIISKIFYGTYENMTKCRECQKDLYNYQKFEFISFGMFNYKGKIFNIYNGFEDNQKMSLLAGDNQFYCNNCKKLCDAELYSKIIFPPNKLLINIDYGKNKKFSPSSVTFGEEIDITKYVIFNFGVPIKYKLIGICTHFGSSGSYGHYVAYCKHPSGRWFIFNDSFVNECSKNSIYGGSPYLLLYEKINYS